MKTPKPGLYETLVTRALAESLGALPAERAQVVPLRDASAPAALHRHLSVVLRRLFRGPADVQIERAEQLLRAALEALPAAERAALHDEIALDRPIRELWSVAEPPTAGTPKHLPRPSTRLSESALLTNTRRTALARPS